jgi:hydrogenase maturation protease
VAGCLRASLPDWVTVLEYSGEPTGLLDAWKDADLAVVIDAVRSDHGSPGEIHRVEVDMTNTPTVGLGVSLHGTNPVEVLDLARALGRLPRRLVLYGIEGGTFSFGSGLSPDVAASVSEAADRIQREVLG